MTNTPNLSLKQLAISQAAKELTVNLNLRYIDSFLTGVVKERRANPPAFPSEGETFLILPPATGAWSGHEGKLASWINGAWEILSVPTGFSVWSMTDNMEYRQQTPGFWIAIRPTKISSQIFLYTGTTATVTVPNGFTSCEVIVIGGGGGGGPVSDASNTKGHAGGGYAGAFCHAYISGFPLGTTFDVFVGYGGFGYLDSWSTSAEPGSYSNFGNYVFCEGGPGGRALDQDSTTAYGFVSVASFYVNGVKYFFGMEGEKGERVYSASAVTRIFILDDTPYSPKSGGSVPGFGRGGESQNLTANSDGRPAQGFGAGGGGAVRVTAEDRPGGDGAPGLVLVRWYAK